MSYGSKQGAGSVPKHPALPPNVMPLFERFSVKIIFSPVSKNEFSSWQVDRYYNASKAHTINQVYSTLAWETSKKGYVAKPDVTIFVDCNAHLVDEFDSTAKGDFKLRSVLSFAVNELKATIYRKALEGIWGICDVHICAFHPCEKLMFALARLLKHSLPDESVYGVFSSFIECQDEYQNAFRWIESKYRWKINVVYGCIFECYSMTVKDRGRDESNEALQKEFDSAPGFWSHATFSYDEDCKKWAKEKPGRRFRNGKCQVLHGNKWLTEDDFEKMKQSPSPDDLRKQANEMEASLREDLEGKTDKNGKHQEGKYEKRSNEIAAKWKQLERQSEEGGNNPDSEFFEKMRAEELEYIQSTSNAPEWQQNNQVNDRIHQRNQIAFDGEYVYDVDLTIAKETLNSEVKERKDQIKQLRKIADDIEDAEGEFWFSVITSGIQIASTFLSFAFPAFAIVDILVTVVVLVHDNVKGSATAVDNTLNGVGITMDALGFVPYVGGAFKFGRLATKLGQLSAKAKAAKEFYNTVVEFEKLTKETIALGGGSKALSALKDDLLILKKVVPNLSAGEKAAVRQELKAGLATGAHYSSQLWAVFMGIGMNGFVFTKNVGERIATDEMEEKLLENMSEEEVEQLKYDVATLLGCDPDDITNEDLEKLDKGDVSSLLKKVKKDNRITQTEYKEYTAQELMQIYDEADENGDKKRMDAAGIANAPLTNRDDPDYQSALAKANITPDEKKELQIVVDRLEKQALLLDDKGRHDEAEEIWNQADIIKNKYTLTPEETTALWGAFGEDIDHRNALYDLRSTEPEHKDAVDDFKKEMDAIEDYDRDLSTGHYTPSEEAIMEDERNEHVQAAIEAYEKAFGGEVDEDYFNYFPADDKK